MKKHGVGVDLQNTHRTTILGNFEQSVVVGIYAGEVHVGIFGRIVETLVPYTSDKVFFTHDKCVYHITSRRSIEFMARGLECMVRRCNQRRFLRDVLFLVEPFLAAAFLLLNVSLSP